MEDFEGFEQELQSAPETNQFAFVFPWSTSSQAYDTSSFDPTLCGGLITRAEIKKIKRALKKIPRPINPEQSEHSNSVFIFILLFSFIGLAANFLVFSRFSGTAGLIGYLTFGVGCLTSLVFILISAVKRLRNKKQRGSQMLNTLSHIQKTFLDQKACLISISKLEAYVMIEFCWKFAAVADDLGKFATQTSDLLEESKLGEDQGKQPPAPPIDDDDDKLDDSEPEDIPYLPNLEILENKKKKKKLDLQTASTFLKSISDVAQHAQNIQQLVQDNIKKLAKVSQSRLKGDKRENTDEPSPKTGEQVEEREAELNKQPHPAKSMDHRGLFVLSKGLTTQKGLTSDQDSPRTHKQTRSSHPASDLKRIQLTSNQEEVTHLVSIKHDVVNPNEIHLRFGAQLFPVPREDSQPSPRSKRESDLGENNWSTGYIAAIKKDRYLEKRIFCVSKSSKQTHKDLQVNSIFFQPNPQSPADPSREKEAPLESAVDLNEDCCDGEEPLK